MYQQQFPDEIRSFSIYKTNIRGRLVRLGKAYADILEKQNYPIQVASLLGEFTAVAIALADSLKYNGQFILQTQSDGPVDTIVSHVKYTGSFRSYANYNEKELKKRKNEKSLSSLLGQGQIAFTVDQGKNTKRYQGITSLGGGNIAECVENYFQASEQIFTSIILIAEPETTRAAALMIQKIPDENNIPNLLCEEHQEESWQNANILMQSVSSEELLDHTLSSVDLLYRLFNESGIQIFDKKLLKYKCHCSKENIASSLSNFSMDDINEMKSSNNLIRARCEFCNTEYTYTTKSIVGRRNSIY